MITLVAFRSHRLRGLIAAGAIVAATGAGAVAAPAAWSPVPSITPRAGLAAATLRDGTILAIGGVEGDCCNEGFNVLDTVEGFRPGDAAFHPVTALPAPRDGLAAVRGADGRIYALGGREGEGGPPLATVYAYLPGANAWRAVAPLPGPRTGLAAAAGRDGRIYAIGGSNAGAALASVVAYDPRRKRWAPVASMHHPRTRLAAATGGDGRIYAIGGDGAGTVEAYDPASNTWSVRAKLPAGVGPAGLAAAAAPSGRLYALGGGPDSCHAATYDPTANAWTVAPSLPTFSGGGSEFPCPWFGLAVATSRGRLYALGGCCITHYGRPHGRVVSLKPR
jgi:N-acetylneuraminic acid mutarotase